jgi:beta-glucosidase
MEWAIVPWGCRKLLEWIDARYAGPEIVITENGASFDDRLELGGVDDRARIAFLEGYLGACHEAINKGVKLKGYFLWSLLDNFEWALGYTRRFGLFHVDFDTRARTPKASAAWYKNVILNNGF